MELILKGVLQEELNRASRSLFVYNEKLKDYPQGKLVTKRRKNNYVNYLVYREGSKVKSDYVKKGEIDDIQILIAKRNDIKIQIKLLKQQICDLEKILKINKNRNGKI